MGEFHCGEDFLFANQVSPLMVHFHICSVDQDVSGVTSMVGTFSNSSYDGALDQWDTSNVVTLESTFGSSSFTGDISDWVSRLCIWIRQRKVLCLLKFFLLSFLKNAGCQQ